MSQRQRSAMTVVGVGPGDATLITLKGRRLLEEAEVVAGFATVLGTVKEWVKGELCPMSYRDQEQVLDYVGQQARLGKRCVVCCWGDLSVSAGELLARVRLRVDEVELVPGVSSVQIACARAGISLEESVFVTLHRRDGGHEAFEELVGYLRQGQRHVILFPQPWDLMPAAVARLLLDQGVPADRSVTVYERLTLEGEREHSSTLQELAASGHQFSDLSILVFPRPAAARDQAAGGSQGRMAWQRNQQ